MRTSLLFGMFGACGFGGVLYDNMGPTNAYRNAASVPTHTPSGHSELASHFYVSMGGTLTGFEGILSLGCCGSGPGQNRQFTLTVYDGTGDVVGAALDSATVIRQLEHSASSGLAPISVPFLGGVWLAPGDYYVGIRSPSEDFGWFASNASQMPPFALRSMSTGAWVYATNGNNFTSRILGEPAPEPAGWQMVIVAGVLAGLRRCSRKPH